MTLHIRFIMTTTATDTSPRAERHWLFIGGALLPLLLRGAGWRPLVPVMLLVSPLLAPHYVALAVLAPVGRLAAACLAWTGGFYLLARLGVFQLTPATEPFVLVPLLAGLLLIWVAQVRRAFAAAPHAAFVRGESS